MTRKDYVLIANALRTEFNQAAQRISSARSSVSEQSGRILPAVQFDQRLAESAVIVEVARTMADALQSENANFDRARFMKAAVNA